MFSNKVGMFPASILTIGENSLNIKTYTHINTNEKTALDKISPALQ